MHCEQLQISHAVTSTTPLCTNGIDEMQGQMIFTLQVVAAGSPQQVADAMKDAEQYKEPLLERGVLVIPLPIYEGDAAAQEPEADASSSASSPEQIREDLRCVPCPLCSLFVPSAVSLVSGPLCLAKACPGVPVANALSTLELLRRDVSTMQVEGKSCESRAVEGVVQGAGRFSRRKDRQGSLYQPAPGWAGAGQWAGAPSVAAAHCSAAQSRR